MIGLQALKVVILFGLLLFTFILGLIPLFIVKYIRRKSESGVSFHTNLKYKRTLSILSCFAAGVFLATCLLELLPDVREDLEKSLAQMDIHYKFPAGEFVMVLGFFLILIVEQIVLSVKERQHSTELHAVNDNKYNAMPEHEIEKEETESLLDRVLDEDRRDHEFLRSVSSEHSICGISDEPHYERRTSRTSIDLRSEADIVPTSPGECEHEHRNEPHEEHYHSTLRSILLTLAISIHSLFEGLAVGLQDTTSTLLSIFVALLLHKGILSFSLGMNLISSKLSDKSVLKSISIFCLSAPIGIAIGIGIIDLWDSEISQLVQGILQGVACGTFLYITFFEVLPHEFNSCDLRLIKVMFLIIGFGTVTVTVVM